jgi:16S rRNA (adenine1518-N6/adenine1519-N6)-dimethyltransferase
MPSKLGQNFLNNKIIVEKIVKSADLTENDLVLEIGPGRGILTEELEKKCKKVIAVEIDKNLVEHLKSKFKNSKNIEIVEGDILEINLESQIPNLKSLKYKIIANLPYYITSPIIRMFLESSNPPQEMILMVQKEVAERIVEKPGKMSILAVSVRYYSKPEILFEVNRKYFNPVPEVDSAVIRISSISNRESQEKRKNFFKVVRAGFCAKRKTLANNLANSFHWEKKTVEEELKKVGISPTTRAQELTIEEWKKISRVFQSV